MSHSTDEFDSKIDDAVSIKEFKDSKKSPAPAMLTQDDYKALMTLLKTTLQKPAETAKEAHTVNNISSIAHSRGSGQASFAGVSVCN